MTTKDNRQLRLADLCRQGNFETAQKELFAEDAVSIEPYATPAFEKETKGLPAIIEKGHKFESMVETMNSIVVSEPLVATIVLPLPCIWMLYERKRSHGYDRALCLQGKRRQNNF